MTLSTVVHIGHPPVVKDLAAHKLEYIFPSRKVRDHMVSLFFPHLETLIVYRMVKGEVEATWGACPITQVRAIAELTKGAINWGVPHKRNTLYVIPEDSKGKRTRVLDDELRDGQSRRADDVMADLDSGEDCLAACHASPSQDLRLYRIADGVLVWWHMGRPIDATKAARLADSETRRAGLDYKALHYHVIGG